MTQKVIDEKNESCNDFDIDEPIGYRVTTEEERMEKNIFAFILRDLESDND